MVSEAIVGILSRQQGTGLFLKCVFLCVLLFKIQMHVNKSVGFSEMSWRVLCDISFFWNGVLFLKLFCLSSVVTLGSMKTVVESRHQTAGEASGPISLCALL